MRAKLLTKSEALSLHYGQHVVDKNGNQYKINGEPKIMKRSGEWKVPIKYGFYGPYGYIEEHNLSDFMSTSSPEYNLPLMRKYFKEERRRQRPAKQKIHIGMKMFKV